MFLAHLWLLCAIILVGFGVAKPILDLAGLSKRHVLIWLGFCLFFAFISDESVYVIMVIPACYWTAQLRWKGGYLRVVCGGLLGAVVILSVLILPKRSIQALGIIAGICAAISVSVCCRYRRMWMAAGMISAPFAWIMLPLLHKVGGALTYTSAELMIDAGIACVVFSIIFAAVSHGARNRRHIRELA